jgi:hypothetical protein
LSDSPHHQSAPMTLIKGGRLTPKEFGGLDFPAKLEHLHRVQGMNKLKLIIGDREAARLTRALVPQELYRLVHDVGTESAIDLLTLASPRQIEFILDQEAWSRYDFSLDKAAEWFDHLLECGEEKVSQVLATLDQELLILFLKLTVEVGGGLGDEVTGDDLREEWDHSFDSIYYLKLKTPKHGQLVLRLLDIIYRTNNALYLLLLEGVKNELEAELEELSFQFRSGRLADAGFPPLDEALGLYRRLTAETFLPATDKALVGTVDEEQSLPALVSDETSFLYRILRAVDSPLLRQELHFLINTALVADGTNLADNEGLAAILARVDGYLTIALEFLSAGDESRAQAIIVGEHLKRLFQLGYSLLLPLQERAKTVESDNYAANKVLLGLKDVRPRFFRGLDADRADGYREFRDLEDVRTIDQFLRSLAGA